MPEEVAESSSAKNAQAKPNLRQQQKAASRRKILDAGISLFSLKGFGGTSIAEIAERAGVKKSLVMHHFSSKDQLWRDCVDDVYARVDEFFVAEYGRQGPRTVDDVRRLQRVYIRACFQFPGYVRIPLVEGTEDNDRVRWLAEKHIQRHHAFTEDALAEVAKRSKIQFDPLKLAAMRTGWVQLLVANLPLYERVAGDKVVTEETMQRWSDELLDLIFAPA